MTIVGFVGLGTMGGPMCARLSRAGHQVSAFDLNPEALDAAVDAGAVAAESAAEAAAGVDVLLTSLPAPSDVETVMSDAGALAALPPGSTWVDLTTSRPELIRRLATQAPDGVSVVDSPLTGAVDGARNGTLTLFAGGEPAAVERVRPVLERLGRVIGCGELGTGCVVKLVTNQLWFVGAAALAEGLAVGVRNGVELSDLWEAIKGSVADSFIARHDAPSIFAGHYDPSFSLGLCVKDLGLLAELEAAVGADLPMTAAARDAFERAAERYGMDGPELSVARRIEDDADLSLRLDGDWVPHWEA
ncbi:NAD(P)-dependent oxidoreductase [Candidatus Poriferisodalis multihospitum]|uniref:NAD(P)-dependent oxidoreductase n=1 Tax=Candidatus Poriferisodalis multihospitum TaxID=2983191 RepID=UPI002B257ED3|nr:NAD(P)-dependent oxidoreductase [Candidatus Poriferisodalis multihospitum]